MYPDTRPPFIGIFRLFFLNLVSDIKINLGERVSRTNGYRNAESSNAYVFMPEVRTEVQNHSTVRDAFDGDNDVV